MFGRLADDFLGRTCVAWEAAAEAAAANGVRVVLLRNGVVLAREAEVLKRQLVPFKLGLGGPLGGFRRRAGLRFVARRRRTTGLRAATTRRRARRSVATPYFHRSRP